MPPTPRALSFPIPHPLCECVRYTCALVLPTLGASLSPTDYNDSTPLPSFVFFFVWFAFGGVFALVCFIILVFVAALMMRFRVCVRKSQRNALQLTKIASAFAFSLYGSERDGFLKTKGKSKRFIIEKNT